MTQEFRLIHADVRMGLQLEDESVDAIVTDPPYELGFMGKSWDSTGVAYNVHVWREALRVLKPGGHLLAFGGSRTYHRLASAIEDAGFEIRDQIMWVYGSGFPKSLDVSKAIDKAAGAERVVLGSKVGMPGYSLKENDTDAHARGQYGKYTNAESECAITAPSTDAAKQWDGWGTALKPAHEPIVVARKPLIGTVAANVMEHGTGALNIDACRVRMAEGEANPSISRYNSTQQQGNNGWEHKNRGGNFDESTAASMSLGRWPANLIHNGSDDVLQEFAKYGNSTSRKGKPRASQDAGEGWGMTKTGAEYNDSGSAARFFYCPKASKKDRGEGNNHPTVKPIELMRYLVRLVTPPRGVVLDPFMGSGTTGKAALGEGFRFIGIDNNAKYLGIAEGRIAGVTLPVWEEA